MMILIGVGLVIVILVAWAWFIGIRRVREEGWRD